MTGLEILDCFRELGVEVELIGDMVQVTPLAKVPSGLMAEAKAHKAEIVCALQRPFSVKCSPALNRPPETEQELRQLMDHLEDPENFTKWLEWAMGYTDPAEDPRQTP